MKRRLFTYVFFIGIILSLVFTTLQLEVYANNSQQNTVQQLTVSTPSNPDIPTPILDHDWDDEGL